MIAALFTNVRARISVGALLPLVVALVAQASYTLASQREAMESGLDSKARSLSSLMVNVAGPSVAFDDDKAVTDSLGYVASDPDFAFVAVRGASGRAIASRGEVDPSALAELVRAPDGQVLRHDDLSVAAAQIVTEGRTIGTVIVGLRADRVHAQATAMSERAAAISLIGMLIATIVVQVLARTIAHRNRQMRVVLDHVDEALATVHRDGRLDRECSAAFVQWFGVPTDTHFAVAIAGQDAGLRENLTLAWADLVEGTLPRELLLMQFPTRLVRGDRHFRMDIKPLFAGAAITGALLRIRDVTSEVEAQATLAAQREYVAVVERALADPGGVTEFIEDTDTWIAKLSTDALDVSEGRRAVHTIKGNAATFGVETVADAAHRLEDGLGEGDRVDRASARELIAAWGAFAGRVERLMGGARDHIHVSRDEVEALAKLAECAGAMAADRLRRLLLESVAVRLEGLRSRIERAADNVCKEPPEVVIAAEGVWIAPDRLHGFWDVVAHVIRNALDHGIEPAAGRHAAGKPSRGRIDLRARVVDADTLILEIADDGRGVDWERVAAKARALGLPAGTPEELERALFVDQLSTAEGVTRTSGRGVGLGAVEAATRATGGRVNVRSELGHGTTFVFTFPAAVAAVAAPFDPASTGGRPPASQRTSPETSS